MTAIQIGSIAGHHFCGPADLVVAHHATRGTQSGFRMTRKRLRDRAAFAYDPQLGWEVDVWFDWSEGDEINTKGPDE
jgi:hypothetical protein